MPGTFYRWFSQRRLTKYGSARRDHIERSRLALLSNRQPPPGNMLEIGPGQGSLAAGAIAAGWSYRGIEASPDLAEALRSQGQDITEAWAPPIAAADGSCDVLYADQVLEHMSGIDMRPASLWPRRGERFVAVGWRSSWCPTT